MNNNFRVAFYLDGRKNKAGLRSILYRIYLATSRLAMGTTGFAIDETMWSVKNGRVMGIAKNARYINSQLESIESDLRAIFRRLEFSEELSLDKIRSLYLRRNELEPEQTLLTYFDSYIEKRMEEVGNGLSYSSIQKYRVTRTRFAEYLDYKYKRKDICFSEIDYNIVSGFEHYLRVVTKVLNNTALRRLKSFKSVIYEAMREGLIHKDPFQGLKMHFDPVDRGFLTEKEVEKIMNYNFKIKRLEHVRDIFIFSCFTGLAYIDVAQLTYDKIVEIDGRLWLITRRQKTNVSSNVPLLDVPLRLIEKYRGVAKNNHVFPVMSNQKQNQYLKEIADVCGIEKNLTYHLARHTFATLTLSKGVSMESVSKMLGHTNIRTTQIYARITNKKIEHDMNMLAEKLGNFGGNMANMPVASTEKPSSIIEDDADIVPSKHRGRPKKVTVQEEDSMPLPTKKRGRPKKQVETAQPSPVINEAIIATPVKKRGRPKKQVAEQSKAAVQPKGTTTAYVNGKLITTREPAVETKRKRIPGGKVERVATSSNR